MCIKHNFVIMSLVVLASFSYAVLCGEKCGGEVLTTFLVNNSGALAQIERLLCIFSVGLWSREWNVTKSFETANTLSLQLLSRIPPLCIQNACVYCTILHWRMSFVIERTMSMRIEYLFRGCCKVNETLNLWCSEQERASLEVRDKYASESKKPVEPILKIINCM